MQLIVRKTKSFIMDGHETLTVNPGSEPLQVPDWVRGTGTFKLAEFGNNNLAGGYGGTADAPASGAGGSNLVEVQILLPAP